MQPLSISDKLRSRNIKRWHTVLTTTQQSVASHSHCMSIIAEQLLENITHKTTENVSIEDKYWVIKYCQLHDLPEIIQGDLSSPYRMLLKELIPDFEQISENIEHELIPELKTIAHYFEKKPYLKLICKAADLLEALSYFQFAKGQDTQHNEVITYKLNEALELICKTGQKQANHLNWNEISKIKEDIINGDSAIINFENIKLFSPH